LAGLFPRLYLDADVTLTAQDLQLLLAPLANGSADLVAARRVHDTTSASRLSAAIARTWEALPFARECAFLGATGLSEAGRNCWNDWPDIAGDDIFMAAMVPPSRRTFVSKATAVTPSPATFWAWVTMRARWLRGERQLGALGLSPPRARAQRKALIERLLTPRHMIGTMGFILARLLAVVVPAPDSPDWVPQRERAMSKVRAPDPLPPKQAAHRSALSRNQRGVRLVASLLDPRAWAHLAKLINYYNYSHVAPRRQMSMGSGCMISPTATFAFASRIHLGARVLVGENTRLWAGPTEACIAIGDDTMLGPNVLITASNYRFRDGAPIRLQSADERDISIGKDVWIGGGAIILAGADIGDGAVIAAGTVVRGTVPPMSVAAGIPAQIIGLRELGDSNPRKFP
jgi:acetyltransferase-like isoleucine patch superfamily enzyme